jgi:hypothetical protein
MNFIAELIVFIIITVVIFLSILLLSFILSTTIHNLDVNGKSKNIFIMAITNNKARTLWRENYVKRRYLKEQKEFHAKLISVGREHCITCVAKPAHDFLYSKKIIGCKTKHPTTLTLKRHEQYLKHYGDYIEKEIPPLYYCKVLIHKASDYASILRQIEQRSEIEYKKPEPCSHCGFTRGSCYYCS